MDPPANQGGEKHARGNQPSVRKRKADGTFNPLRRKGVCVVRKQVDPVFISVSETADLFSLSPSTIKRRCKDGTFDAIRIGRNTIRIRRESVEAVLASDGIKATS